MSARAVISSSVEASSRSVTPLASRWIVLCVPIARATDIGPSAWSDSPAAGRRLRNVRTVDTTLPSRWIAIDTGYRPRRGMLSASGRTSSISNGMENVYWPGCGPGQQIGESATVSSRRVKVPPTIGSRSSRLSTRWATVTAINAVDRSLPARLGGSAIVAVSAPSAAMLKFCAISCRSPWAASTAVGTATRNDVQMRPNRISIPRHRLTRSAVRRRGVDR